MQKKIIMFVICLLLLGTPYIKVEAKTTKILECTYETWDKQYSMSDLVRITDPKHNGITVTISKKTSWGKDKGLSTTAKVYYLQGYSKSTKLSISNWSNIEAEFEKNSRKYCFNYLLLYFEQGKTDKKSKAKEIYLSNSKSDLEEIISDKGWTLDTNAVIIAGSNSIDDEDNSEEAYEYVENATKTMESYDFDINTCKSGTDVSKCQERVENYSNEINEFQGNVFAYVTDGSVKEDDSRVEKFFEVYSDVYDKINNFDFEVDADEKTYDPTGGNTGNSGSSTKFETTASVKQCVSCGNGALTDIPAQLPMFSRNLIHLVQLLVPIILIGLGIYDFIKAIVSGDEKLQKESQNRFIKRIIAAVLIFFVVAIVKFIFGLIPSDVNTLGCVPCFVSDSSSCGTSYTCDY